MILSKHYPELKTQEKVAELKQLAQERKLVVFKGVKPLPHSTEIALQIGPNVSPSISSLPHTLANVAKKVHSAEGSATNPQEHLIQFTTVSPLLVTCKCFPRALSLFLFLLFLFIFFILILYPLIFSLSQSTQRHTPPKRISQRRKCECSWNLLIPWSTR